MKKIIVVVAVVVAVGIGIFTFWTIDRVTFFDAYMEGLTIGDVDLKQVEDGIYYGHENGKVIEVEVQVAVEDNRIIDIDLLKHVNGQGEGAEPIVDDILEAQSVQIDNISGATLSSKVIRKAVENALNN